MSSAAVANEVPACPPPRRSASSGLHLIALALPLYVLAFVLTGPHPWYASLPWLAAVPVVALLDRRSGSALHEPLEGMPELALRRDAGRRSPRSSSSTWRSRRAWWRSGGLLSADTLVAVLLVGANSG